MWTPKQLAGAASLHGGSRFRGAIGGTKREDNGENLCRRYPNRSTRECDDFAVAGRARQTMKRYLFRVCEVAGV